MNWLPKLFKSNEIKPVEVKHYEIEVAQTKALTQLAQAQTAIAEFLTGGGLTAILSGYARSQAVKDILGGLASHDGRNALDARVLDQNAHEISEQVERVFEKYQDKLAKKNKEQVDPEIHNAEDDFNKWRKENA